MASKQTMVENLVNHVMQFDETALVRALSRIADKNIASFGAACASRLRNDADRVWSDRRQLDLLTLVHEAIWRSIIDGQKSHSAGLEVELLEVIPSESEDSSFEASVVEDALAASVYALRSLEGDAPQNAAWAARRAYETADRFAAQLINEPQYSELSENLLLCHPIVQQELHRQQRDLEALSECDDVDRVGSVEEVMRVSEEETVLTAR